MPVDLDAPDLSGYLPFMICLLSYVYSVGMFTSRTITLARGYSLASLPVVGQERLDFLAKAGL
jgi:hypothetical protein